MEYIISDNIKVDRCTVVTLGNFDGIHMGHRKLIDTVLQRAKEKNMLSVVCSFWPHPKTFFNRDKAFALILTPEENFKRIEQMGVDMYLDVLFSAEFAALPAEEFAEKYLFIGLNCKVLVVGENYRFGKDRKGDTELLEKIGKRFGAEVIVIPDVMVDGKVVSSSRIRNLLREGDIEYANRLLCRPYFVIGTVVGGKRLGRVIGFPTANILANSSKLFPPNGVYITHTVCDGVHYNSVSNIGINPTVNGNIKTIETHIIDFNKKIYGEKIEVKFLKFLRTEKKFNSIEELKEQINLDKISAKKYFDEH